MTHHQRDSNDIESRGLLDHHHSTPPPLKVVHHRPDHQYIINTSSSSIHFSQTSLMAMRFPLRHRERQKERNQHTQDRVLMFHSCILPSLLPNRTLLRYVLGCATHEIVIFCAVNSSILSWTSTWQQWRYRRHDQWCENQRQLKRNTHTHTRMERKGRTAVQLKPERTER